MNTITQPVVGIDLGGTTLKYGIVSNKGEILYENHVPTNAILGPDAVLKQFKTAITDALKHKEGQEIQGIGIGSPGVVDSEGNVHSPPNFTNWRSVPLAKEIEKIFCIKTVVDNDANVAAIAEAKFGAGIEFPDFLFVIWGTGVGGGVILDHKIYHGPTGGAGEIGHITIDYNGPTCNCGNIGCVEAYIGQRYLSQRTAERLKLNPTSKILEYVEGDITKIEPVFIAKAAHDGDIFARNILIEAGMLLGVGLSSVMNILDFRISIIGGGISAAGDFVIQAVEDSVRSRVLAPLKPGIKVLPAKLGNQAGILGAAGLVL